MKVITDQIIRECFVKNETHRFVSMSNGNRITVDHPDFLSPVTMFVFPVEDDYSGLKIFGGDEKLHDEMTAIIQRHLMREYDTYLVPYIVASKFVVYKFVYYLG